MPTAGRPLGSKAGIVALLTLGFAAAAAAQQRTVAEPPSQPEFFARTDFHLTAAALLAPSDMAVSAEQADKRFAWDTHWGGSIDVVDYVVGRMGVVIDYEAVLGREYRLFDPNQGNYTLEGSLSARTRSAEIVAFFHHVSRHLSDRAKRIPIAWNELGGRVLHRAAVGGGTLDMSAEAGKTTEHAYADYTWLAETSLLLRHPVSDRVGVFARVNGQIFAVDGTVPGRGRQTGGAAEAGIRLNARGGALELFAGIEKRVDADPLDRQARHWALAGFRLLSR